MEICEIYYWIKPLGRKNKLKFITKHWRSQTLRDELREESIIQAEKDERRGKLAKRDVITQKKKNVSKRSLMSDMLRGQVKGQKAYILDVTTWMCQIS